MHNEECQCLVFNNSKQQIEHWYNSPYTDREGFYEDLSLEVQYMDDEEREWFYELPVPLS